MLRKETQAITARAQQMGEQSKKALTDYSQYQLPPVAPRTPLSLRRNFSLEEALIDGYAASHIVYACVSEIAEKVASIPWGVVTLDKDGNEVFDWEHEGSRLLNRPNPEEDGRTMMETITAQLLLNGNSYRVRNRIVATVDRAKYPNGKTKELWGKHPDQMFVVPNPNPYGTNYHNILKYEYRVRGSVVQTYNPSEVIHFKLNDPGNCYYGFSPLQAAARVVDTDVQAVEWNRVSLGNRGVPDGLLASEEFLTNEQYDLLVEQVDAQVGYQNAHRPWVLGGDVKWQGLGMTAVEMDFILGRAMGREDICSVYGMPPPCIGFYENATLANIETARRILWLDTIIPFCEGLAACLTKAFQEDWGEEIAVGFDTGGVDALQEEIQPKIEAIKSLWGMGCPFFIAAQTCGLQIDRFEGDDVGWLPTSIQKVEDAIKTPEERVADAQLMMDATAESAAAAQDNQDNQKKLPKDEKAWRRRQQHHQSSRQGKTLHSGFSLTGTKQRLVERDGMDREGRLWKLLYGHSQRQLQRQSNEAI